MKIVVNIKNKTEKRKLTAFLDAMKITYQSDSETDNNIESYREFLNEYNNEIDDAVHEIENNSYIAHKDVIKRLAERRKAKG
jgi:hypothetical protein